MERETIKSEIATVCAHYRRAVYVIVGFSYGIGAIVGAALYALG